MPLPPKLILQVDPAKVAGYVGTRYPRPMAVKRHLPLGRRLVEMLAYLRHSRLFDPAWDRRARPIDGLDKYLKVKDLAEHLASFRDSAWYRSCQDEIRRRGCAMHKKIRMASPKELDRFFATYACDLLRSMRDHGYLPERCHHHGGIAVGRDGELLKTNGGDHRFFAARCLGVKPVPLQVKYLHPRWLRARGLSLHPRDADRLRAALHAIEQEYQ